MIIKPAQADAFVRKPPKALAAALFYGPDDGLVRERADTLAKTAVDDLSDPFRVADLSGAMLEVDSARLADEWAAISMLGGRRVIRVRMARNALAKTFEPLLESPPGDTLVVVEAGELTKAAALRRLFERADRAGAVGCYSDSGRDLTQLVRETLKAQGLHIAGPAVAEAVARLGSDRGVTRRELEKLALYAVDAGSVTAADVRAVMGNESELRMEEACDAAGEGDFAALDTALSRLWAAGTSPVAVLRLALSHFERVLMVRVRAQEGDAISSVIRELRPPVHFSREKSFLAQSECWSPARLEAALAALYEGEVLAKTTAVPGEAACGQALIAVCRMGARARAASD